MADLEVQADLASDQGTDVTETELREQEPTPETTAGFVRLDALVAQHWRRYADAWGGEPGRAVEAFVSAATILACTAVIFGALNPGDFLSSTTPTGGDMGSHLWGPRFLIDHLLPHGRLSGWTPDWYSGFPAYQFYMVVPSLFVVALHVGLPVLLAPFVVLGALAVTVSAWWFARLYRWRWLLTVAMAVVIVLTIPVPYNQAFKLVTASGLLAMPFACWFLARSARLAFPIPALAAAGSLIFIFNQQPLYNNTGNIIGGNFTSTMAGEFAFSISLTLSILYLGVAVRGLRTGRHRALAAGLFALAGLCHLIPAFFVLACTVALFLVSPGKGRLRWLATTVPVAGLLTAFWVVPFALRSEYVNDMGWERLPFATGEHTSVWYYLMPGGLRYLFFMALLGVIFSVIQMYRVGLVLAIAWMSVWAAFIWLPQIRLWNARLLPFMFLSVSLLAAIGLGELIRVVGAAAAGNSQRPLRPVTVTACVAAVAFTLLYVVLPMNGMLSGVITREAVTLADGQTVTQSSLWRWKTTYLNPALGWSGNNYTGLEGKTAVPAGCDEPGSEVACTSGGFKEYKAVIATMSGIGQDDRFGCGRAMWEYDGDRIGGYGTPMALMMLPYFTNGCIASQEGLYFESSATVPYHFLMQAELSTRGSTPQRDLPYPGFDMDAGVRHMQLLGVRYYMASTQNAVDQANRHPDLTAIAVSGPWHIYEVSDAATVAPLLNEPVVATGIDETQHGWLPIASAWFRSSDASVNIAATGPKDWKRVEARPVPAHDRNIVKWVRDQLGATGPIDQLPSLPQTELEAVEVSNIEQGTNTISFDVSKPGVPVLVKTSYFPNWKVSGGSGPYRVTPNLMVVIPTDTHVSMDFGRTPIDLGASALTILGLVGLVMLARRPQIEVAPEKQPWLSMMLDSLVDIPAVVDPTTTNDPSQSSGSVDSDDPLADTAKDTIQEPDVVQEPEVALEPDLVQEPGVESDLGARSDD